jgi:enoyl-CoA hydratase
MADANIEEKDGVITVTFDRQNKLNAISPEMTQVLWDAVTRLGDRDDLRCMVIMAKGRYFAAGVDLSVPIGNRPADPETAHLHPGWNYRRNYRSHHLLYDEFENVEKPIIQVIQGVCLGAGLEMAMSCDFRFCTVNAEFALPELDIGVVAGSGGTTRLTRLVGPAWGKWLGMAGMRVGADQALALGLVHQILSEDSLAADVRAFCDRLMKIPAETLGLAKLTVDMATDLDRTSQRHLDRIVNTGLEGSEENLRRIARFRKEK